MREIAAMSQTRLLILWLAAYERRGGGGREGEKNSKTFDSSYRIAPDESVCGRGVFFPRFLASAASPFDAAFDDYRANF